MLSRLRERQEWKFFAVLPRADRGLAFAWWSILLLRGVLPAGFAIAMGALVAAVQRGESLAAPLAAVGVVFVLLQVLAPLHQAIERQPREPDGGLALRPADRGLRAAAGDGAPRGPEAHRGPHGGARVRRRDDRPADAHQHGLHRRGARADGRGARLGGRPLRLHVVGAPRAGRGVARHALAAAGERGLARPQHRGGARGAAPRRVRLPARRGSARGQGAAPLRPGRLGDGALRRPADPAARAAVRGDAAAREAARLEPAARGHGQRGGVLVAGRRRGLRPPRPRARGRLRAGGGRRERHRLRGAELGARRRRGPGGRGAAAGSRRWPRAGALATPRAAPRRIEGPAAHEIRFRDLTFAYPGADRPVLEGFDLAIPAGSSLAIVGQNGAGKTTLAKLLCRLYDPQAGAIEVDGVDLRDLDVDAWRSRITAVFQDFIRFELPLRDNVAPGGAPDDVVLAALDRGGRFAGLADARDAARPGLPGRHGSLGRPVAARRPGPGAVRGAARARASCCSTSPPPSSTSAARPRSSTASSPPPGSARRSSSPIASRPCATPTASACSSTAGWSSSGPTTSSWRRAAATARCSTCRPGASPRDADEEEEHDVLTDAPRLTGPAARPRRRCGGCCKLGYRHEPRLMAAVVRAVAARRAAGRAPAPCGSSCSARASLDGDRRRAGRLRRSASARRRPPPGSCVTVSTRVQRRFRDRVTIALESHVARLQASIATIAHQERPEYLDRLSVLRDQVFVLDHMYMSLFTTCGVDPPARRHDRAAGLDPPALALLGVFALPDGAHLDLAARRRARRRGARRARPAGWPGTCS